MAAVGTAQQHSTPALTNAGASVYFPQAGRYLGDAGQRSTKDTLWDFNDHMNIDSTAAALANYQTDLIYDVGPALDGGSAPVGIHQCNKRNTQHADHAIRLQESDAPFPRQRLP